MFRKINYAILLSYVSYIAQLSYSLYSHATILLMKDDLKIVQTE